MYYVGFSTATIVASLILFQGFNTHDATNTVSLLAGFVVTFLGVHILNLSREPESPLEQNGHGVLDSGVMNPRLSLQGRLSIDGWHGIVTEGTSPRPPRMSGHGRRSSLYRAQSSTLFSAFEADDDAAARPLDSVGLHRLREEDESDGEDADERTRLRTVPEEPIGPRASRSHSRSPNPRSLSDTRMSSGR